ncbi:hypothetical protein SCALIN_C46_0034 [Candidatus Scalindua japonica]|uniref:Uncharacterized protein n=1 Tax=Candidatus Scalindua japonica TaxID=1284222 RepID=A0A286U4G0_9BACT|nr:hypothetical protein SCALIN_C46_0034 [Candidatus Scalindua japonica]
MNKTTISEETPITIALLPKYKPLIRFGTISDIRDAQTGTIMEPIIAYKQ